MPEEELRDKSYRDKSGSKKTAELKLFRHLERFTKVQSDSRSFRKDIRAPLTLRSMASIYKRASKAQADEDSDESMSDVSSSTVRADSDDEDSSSSEDDEQITTNNKFSQVPIELRNRILMLTSRGVSFRSVATKSSSLSCSY